MKQDLQYKPRLVCPNCMSLSIKKSYKKYVCNNCLSDFDKPITVKLLHKYNRCIDNDIESRLDRLNKDNIVVYEV